MATNAGPRPANSSSAASSADADSAERGGHNSKETKRPAPIRSETVATRAAYCGGGRRRPSAQPSLPLSMPSGPLCATPVYAEMHERRLSRKARVGQSPTTDAGPEASTARPLGTWGVGVLRADLVGDPPDRIGPVPDRRRRHYRRAPSG